MHTIQWDGTGVSWSPRDDTYTLAVAAALHPPDLVAWLDQHLGAWLHERFAVGSFEVEVPPPVYEANRVPFTQIIIRGLREPFPDPTALQQSVLEAVTHGEQEIEAHERVAQLYEESHRRPPAAR